MVQTQPDGSDDGRASVNDGVVLNNGVVCAKFRALRARIVGPGSLVSWMECWHEAVAASGRAPADKGVSARV